MKSSPVRRVRGSRTRRRDLQLEGLESRNLMSINIGGININVPTNFPLTNGLNLASLSSFLSPNSSDYWWLKNTGQTLTNPNSGPATGKAGADISALDAWTLTRGKNSVVIAVLDTGIDLNNSDLAAALWTNPNEIAGDGIDNDGNGRIDDVHGWDFLGNSNDVSDNFVHGTAVAATIRTVAPNVTILPVKIGTAAGANPQDVINGINYLIGLKQRGVNIIAINASFISYTAPTSGQLAAIKNAGTNGMMYVSAAGNGGINFNSFLPGGILANYASSYISTYVPSNLLYVAATDNRDGLASFSDYGSKIVSLGAPGVDITLPIPGGIYASLSGTSFAAPMVSATAALLKSLVPGATMTQIKNAITSSVDVIPSLVGKTITGGRLNVYKALETLLGQQAAQGWVDSITNEGISGWSFDPNAGTKAVSMQIVVDGVTQATVQANQTRNDLTAAVGSANHGFSYALPGNLSGGSHTVQVYAVDFAPFGAALPRRLIGQGTVSVPWLPTGSIDGVSTTQIFGWAIDRDTPTTSVTIRLDVDGAPARTGTANNIRGDLTAVFGSANHGYTLDLPDGLTPGMHRLDVYAYDTATGSPRLVASRTLNTNQPPMGSLDYFDGTHFGGWAFDPNSGSASIQVLYKLDNNDPVLVTAGDVRGDLVGVLGSTAHGFNVTLPRLTAGPHTVTAWAVDPTTKVLTLLRSLTATAAVGPTLPRGSVDALSTTLVAGWAQDADLGGAPATIRIDIDGVHGTPFLANQNRPDLTAVLGGPNFGYSQTLSLSPGQHRIEVFVLDAPETTPVLLASRIVGNTAPPAGSIDFADASQIFGWAHWAAMGSDSVTLRIDIDGVAAFTTVANGSRGDLTPLFGAGNFGLNSPLPKLAAGPHTLAIWAINPLTLSATPLATKSIVTA